MSRFACVQSTCVLKLPKRADTPMYVLRMWDLGKNSPEVADDSCLLINVRLDFEPNPHTTLQQYSNYTTCADPVPGPVSRHGSTQPNPTPPPHGLFRSCKKFTFGVTYRLPAAALSLESES